VPWTVREGRREERERRQTREGVGEGEIESREKEEDKGGKKRREGREREKERKRKEPRLPPKLLLCAETNISINSIIKQLHTRNQDTLHTGYVSAVFLSPFRHQHDPAIGSYVVF